MLKYCLYARIRLLLALLLTTLLVSCSRAIAPIPSSAIQQSDPRPDLWPEPQLAPQAVIPPHPNAVVRFQKISLEEGLSQGIVNVILQDRQGFIWFGTQDGLNRYDGYNFKVYKSNSEDPASLSDNWIESLFEDKDGYIWIGTYQGGLNKYDPLTDTFTHFIFNPNNPASIGSGTIYAILQDRSGTLWVGSEDGLNKFDPATNSFTHYRNNPNAPNSLSNNNIHAIYQSQGGSLWIGTLGGGLERFDPITGKFQHFRANPDAKSAINNDMENTVIIEEKNAISNDIVRTVLEDANGDVWIGTERGLNRFDSSTGQFRHYMTTESNSSISNNTVYALLIDRAGTLWVGTEFGLNRFDETSGKFTRYISNPLISDSLSSNTISSLYEDREGVLWVGTMGGGVNKHSPTQDKFTFYRSDPGRPLGIPVEDVISIYADPSGIAWLGTDGGGLARFDPTTGLTIQYKNDPRNPRSLRHSSILAIYRDHAGILWIGTKNGLDQMNELEGEFIHHTDNKDDPNTGIRSNYISAIYESPDETFWIGTKRGLDRYERATGVFTHIVDPAKPQDATAKPVTSIFEDRDGRLWVGTFGAGAFRLDRKNGTFRYYKTDAGDPTSLNRNVVLSIYQDFQGTIWLATAGGGLNKYNEATDSFSALTEHDGLPNNFIYCIIPDELGNLWLPTDFGLSRFNPFTETFQNYTTGDGLQSNEFTPGACSRSVNGDIYVGGIEGINLFTPSQIRANSYIPPMALTSFTQNEKPIPIISSDKSNQEIVLNWSQNPIQFEFTSLSFADPLKNQYAYMLEGFDTKWNKIGNKHEGRYTNLPGGEYKLRLKGSNNDGVWNEIGTTINITVMPPFWQTWWFYLLVGLTVIAGVLGGYRLRVHGIESRQRELEYEVQERTRKIQHLFEQTKELAIIEERNRLARDLHDSAKQKAFAALAQIGTASGIIQNNNDPSSAREHLNEAENLVYDVIQELTFLIQEMYPLALKEKGLATSVREYLYEWENRTGIPISVCIENERRLPLKMEQALYRITQEALANIARHSHANAVEVAMKYGIETIHLSISDDGCGFDPKQKPNGIGLCSIRERAESINGQVIIESAFGKGTCINIIVPGKTILGE